jgi:hypothetical protein
MHTHPFTDQTSGSPVGSLAVVLTDLTKGPQFSASVSEDQFRATYQARIKWLQGQVNDAEKQKARLQADALKFKRLSVAWFVLFAAATTTAIGVWVGRIF